MTFIYVLKCPFDGSVRYVGKGKSLKARLRQHISEARLGQIKSHKCDWIRSVLKRGGRPVIEVDEVVPHGRCWKEAERRRISLYRDAGANLTNGTDGGDGSGPLTEEGRKALSERARAQFGTEVGRARQAKIMKSLCADPLFVQARAAAGKRTRATPEYKSKASERSRALWADPIFREKMRMARARVTADPAFRAKLSAALTAAQADPEVRRMKAEKARSAWATPEIRERQVAAIRAASRGNSEVTT